MRRSWLERVRVFETIHKRDDSSSLPLNLLAGLNTHSKIPQMTRLPDDDYRPTSDFLVPHHPVGTFPSI